MKKIEKISIAKSLQAKSRPACHGCSKSFTGGFAYFSFGATLDECLGKKKNADPPLLEGFCHLGYHGTDSEMRDSADFVVAENAPLGQLDLQFCSLECMKAWFCKIIDTVSDECRSRTAPRISRVLSLAIKRLPRE